jgi:predicted ArsR family transcriptional regulator
MDVPADPAVAGPGSGRPDRVGVLEFVRAAEAGVTTADVAAKLGLRPSTAHSHLDNLVAAGLLVKARASGGQPYRPAWRYRAVTADPAPTTYRVLLAAVLDELAAGDDDRSAAARVGRRWGRMLAANAPGTGDAPDRLLAVLDALGFSPAPPGAAHEMHLRTCPYLDLVRQHPDAMCRLHAGLIDGVLQQVPGHRYAAVLEPFAAPEACVVRFTARSSRRRHRDAPG